MFVPVPSPKEMAVWDAETIKLGIPEEVLMENAARAALDVLLGMMPEEYALGGLRGAKILLVMGAGNNGGDAACLARHLCDAGAYPVLIRGKAGEIEGKTARLYENLARNAGVNVEILGDTIDVMGAWAKIFPNSFPDILIDGLLGTGFCGALRARESEIIAHMNALAVRGKCTVVALDVPSGLDANSGHAAEHTVRADITVCFQAAKPGLLMPESAPWVGKLVVRPIGIPRQVMEQNPASSRLWLCPWQMPSQTQIKPLAADEIMGVLGMDNTAASYFVQATPKLSRYNSHFLDKSDGPSHKGEAGKVLIIGGGRGMSGAIRLAAWGALRAGAGLITVAAPAAEMLAIQASLAEVVTIPLPEIDEKEWSADHVTLLAPTLKSCRAVVIGPGMGRENGAEDFLEAVLTLPDRPSFILDADALFALAKRPNLLKFLHQDDILTPHPGEAAFLLSASTPLVQADRVAALHALHVKAHAIWVLKGAGTLISSTPVTLCPWHVPTLAVAGSGDVLAGLIGALVAQKFSSPLAASFGVYWHALAGLHLLQHFPMRGNSPQDIADALPLARIWL